jgi:DNA polymerase-3 subunit gamma/tau
MELLQTQAQRIESDTVLRIIDAFAAAEGRLRYALSKRIFFEIALVKAIKAREMTGIDAVLKKLNELKSGGVAATVPAAPRPSPVRPRPESAAETAATTTSVPLDEAWEYAVEHLGKVTPLAKTYLVGTRPLRLEGNVVVIGFDPEFADRREFVDTGRNRELLQSKLKEKLRMDISLRFEVTEGATPVRQPVSPAKPAEVVKGTAPAKKDVGDFKNDPLIKKALEIFKGTIVDVRK